MRIVLHADDFGASQDTVRATIECVEAGAVTSVSVMPAMPETGRAIEYLRENPGLDVGVHLTFVGDGEEGPVSSPDEIPDLVDANGRLLPTGTVRMRALTRRLSVEQIEREARAQIASIVDQGIAISHVDSHRHVHKLPAFREALARALPAFGVNRVRAVQNVFLRRPLASPTYWIGSLWQRRIRDTFTTTDHMYMPTSASDVGWEGPLTEILRRLSGTLEVGVHPGFGDWRDGERRSVLGFADLARANGHEIVSWGRL